MISLIGECGLFVKAVFWRWWGLMSCALWTLTALYGEIHHKENPWYVTLSFDLMVVLIPTSTFLAWREQYKRVSAQNKCISAYEDKTADLIWVSSAAWNGNLLSGTAPGEDATEEERSGWKHKVESWVSTTRELLVSISPIAANKFFYLGQMHSNNFYGVHESLWSDLSLLNDRLHNLTEIMEKSNVYLAKIIDRP
jgi:hypothetical protein